MTGLVTKSAADYDESFDAIIDRHFGSSTRFRTLEVACDGNPSSGWTARGQNGKTPCQVSPLELYRRIYGEGFTDPNKTDFSPDPAVMVRHSVLSALRRAAVSLSAPRSEGCVMHGRAISSFRKGDGRRLCSKSRVACISDWSKLQRRRENTSRAGVGAALPAGPSSGASTPPSPPPDVAVIYDWWISASV